MGGGKKCKKLLDSSYIFKADFQVGYIWIVRKNDSRIFDLRNQMDRIAIKLSKDGFL